MIKNVEACKQLSKITRTSLGPNGASPRQIRRPPSTPESTTFATRLVPIVRLIVSTRLVAPVPLEHPTQA